MIKNKNLLLEIEDFINENLPPRTNDAKIIADTLLSKPIKLRYGFCGMCDSNIRNEWVINNDLPHFELRHLAHIEVLRISEIKILIDALEKNELNNFFKKNIKNNFLEKISNFLKK